MTGKIRHMGYTKGFARALNLVLLISLLLICIDALARGKGGPRGGGPIFPPPTIPSMTIHESASPHPDHDWKISNDGNWQITWSESRVILRNGTPKPDVEITYVLEESAGGGVFAAIYIGPNRSFTVQNHTVDERYSYRIKACSPSRCSSYSASQTVALSYVHPSTINFSGLNDGKSASGNFGITWRLPTSSWQTVALQRIKTAELQVNNTDNAPWQTVVARGRSNSYSESNLPQGDYSYRILKYTNHYTRRLCSKAKGDTGCDPNREWIYVYEKTTIQREAAKAVSVLPPEKPKYLSASYKDNKINLSWSQVSHTTGYTVQQSKNGGAWSGGDQGFKGSTLSHTFDDIKPGTYKFRVRACRGGYTDSHCSESWRESAEIEVTIGEPEELRVSNRNPYDTSITLLWNKVDHASYYAVYRNENPNPVKRSYTYFTDTELADGTYTYRVEACYDAQNCKMSESLSVTVLQKPEKPTWQINHEVALDKGKGVFEHTNVTDTSVSLRWNGQTRTVDNYKLHVWRADYGSDNFTAYTSKTIESETSNDGAGYLKYEFNADQDGHYKYQLEACNSSGCSEKSDLSSAVKMLTVKPHKPTGFAVIDKQLDPKHYVDQVYKVRWNHNASTDSVSHYNLERATKPWGGNSFNIDTISVDSDSQAEAPYCSFDEYQSSDDLCALGAGDGHYQYRVQACNDAYCGEWSDTISVSVLAVPDQALTSISQKANYADASYTLSWSEQSTFVEQYKVSTLRADNSNPSSEKNYIGQTETIINRGQPLSINYDHRDLSNNHLDGDYLHKIEACNASGCSESEREVRVISAPLQPTNLRITDKKINALPNFIVRWDSQSRRVTHYELYRGQADYVPAPQGPDYKADTLLENPVDIDKRAVPQTLADGHYRYRVLACNEFSCSDPSDYASTTLLKIPEKPNKPSLPTESEGAFLIGLSYGDGRVESIQLQQSINGGDWEHAPVSSYQDKPSSIPLTRSAYINDGTDTLAKYRFRAAACNSSGCSDFSVPSEEINILPPGTPAGFTALVSELEKIVDSAGNYFHVDSDGSYSLEWQDIGNIVSQGVEHIISYKLEDSVDNGQTWRAITLNDDSANSHQISENAEGIYTYRLRACLQGIGCGAWSHNLQVRVAFEPEMVTELSAPLTSTSLSYDLSWSEPAGNVTHYQLERNAQIYETHLTALTYAETVLGDGVYEYRVRACNYLVCSSSWSSLKTTEVLLTPTAPQFLGGDSQNNSTGHAWIYWTEPATGRVDFYQIKTSHSPHNSWENPLDVGNVFEHIFSDADGEYHFSVRACNRFANGDNNCGAASAEHSVTLLNAPAAPTGIQLTDIDTANGSFTLVWEQPQAVTDYYELLENDRASVGNLTQTQYQVTGKSDGTYRYRVRACNSTGCSGYSQTEVSVDIQRMPGAVTNLRGGQTSRPNERTLTWKAPDIGTVTYYNVRSNLGATHSINPKMGQLWVTTTFNFTPPVQQQTEIYRVCTLEVPWWLGGCWWWQDQTRVVVEAQEGDHTYWISACNTQSCGPETQHVFQINYAPASPGYINGTGVSTTGDYELTWLAGNGNITGYELQERPQGGNEWSWKTIGSENTLQHSVSNQSAGHYQYRLRACNNRNCGVWSQIKSVSVDRYSIPNPTPIQAVFDPGVPSGMDAVGSIEGQFRVNESGAASYTIPITLAAGTAGVAPQLSLVYNSQGGNGLVGKGWTLSGLGIINRCRQTLAQDGKALAIDWSDQDRFCLNGQRLLVISGDYGAPNSQYKTEIDSFSKITAHAGSMGDPAYFSVEGKDGSTTYYGRTSDAKQITDNNQTYSWAISRLEDNVGNAIDFSYHNDAQGHRIEEINYAYGSGTSANARVEFDYEDRLDVLQAYIGGHRFRSAKRLTNIKSYNRYEGGEALLRDYRLGYIENTNTVAGVPQLSRLNSVSECTSDGSCLPATRFNWQQGSDGFGQHNDGQNVIDMNSRHYLIDFKYTDINGDGLQDMIYVSSYSKVKKKLFSKPKVYGHQNVHIMINTNSGLVHSETTKYTDTIENPLRPHILDYNADGHQDMLIYSESREWELYLATTSGQGHWSLQRQHGVNLPFAGEDIQFADINADGLADAFDGKHYWLLERDTDKPASSNQAYAFGAQQTISCINCDSTTEAKSVAGDINADGIADFMISQTTTKGRGIKEYNYYLIQSDLSNGQLRYHKLRDNSGNPSNIGTISDYELFRAVDINADALTDILYWNHTSKHWQMQLNTGDGFTNPVELIAAKNIDKAQDQAVQLADINRDGYPDLTWQEHSQIKIRYWSNAQQTFSTTSKLRSIVQRDKTNHILMDYNGDGATDYIKFYGDSGGHGGTFSYASSGDAANHSRDAERNISNVITQITNGLGAVTELNYQRINQSDHYAPLEPDVTSCNWRCSGGYNHDYSEFNDPFGDLPDDAQTLQPSPVSPVLPVNGALPIVSRVSSSAPVENNPHAKSHITYFYSAARVQALGRGSLGFKKLRTLDEQTGVMTTTTYRQDWPFIGSPWKTKVETANGHLLSQSTNHWALQGWQSHWPEQFKNNGSTYLGALKPYIAETKQQTYALQGNGASGGSLLKTTTAETSYDGYGNATQIINRDFDGYGNLARKQTTTNTYGSSDYDREKGRLSKTTVTTERPGQTSKTRESTFSYYSSGTQRGLLQTETVQSNGDQSQKLQTTHYYDSLGNPTHTQSQGWDGQQTSTRASVRNTYDSSGRYIVDSYQQYPGLGEKRISSVVSRNAYGSPTVVSDSLGNRAYSYYSPRGRKYFTHSDAGGWQKTWLSSSASQCPSGTAYVARTQNADGSASQQCNDKLGRPIRKLSTGFDGRWIATDMHYDALGRTVRSSEPSYIHYGDDEPVYWSYINYDLLDRPIQITAADGSVSHKQYNGLQTVSINPQGQQKTEIHNSLGEVVTVTDNLGGQTHYSHDALGQLVGMTDANGNQTQLVYDALGRKLSMNDPDKGHWQYSYNAFGELINQIDAKGQSTQISYDSLGRKTQRIDRQQDGHIEQQTNWTYDSQANGLGQLAQVSNSQGYQLVAYYDNFGRNHRSDTTLPGLYETFSEYQTFDHLGRVWQRFDASSGQQQNGERGTQTQYNAYGYASAITDVRHNDGLPINVYQQILAMDARGNITAAEQGNGIINTQKHYNYATGLLEQINSNHRFGDNLQDLHYQWDNLGNLQTRSEFSGSKNLQESFYYDGLNRLEIADSGSQQQSVQYDSLGNITYKSDVGAYSYGYGNGSGAGPHAVTQAGDTSYHYDANGNNISSSDGRTLVYSTFDKVIEINKGSHQVTFAYGPERSRYQRTDHDSSTGESKTTYYLGSVELIDYNVGSRKGEREYKRQLGNALETLLYKDGQLQSQSTHYLLHDHLGSIDVITDDLGNIAQTLSFDAWGQRRGASDWQTVIANEHKELIENLNAFSVINRITNRGYTGHEMVDAVGIIHMNGRIYDAKLARFLQADPFIQAPYNTQSLNRYSYVWNNPLNATDPSMVIF